MCPFFTTLTIFDIKFLDEHFHFHTKKIETKIPTTTMDSQTAKIFVENFILLRKDFSELRNGKILSTRCSSLLLVFLPNKLGALQETGV